MKWERVEGKDRAISSSDDEVDQELRTTARVYVRRGALGPGKMWGHTCNVVQRQDQTLLYVFGGCRGFGAGDNFMTNDLYVFDTAEKMWSQPKARGMPPCPRDSHSCTTVGQRLFVFGGTNSKRPLRDLHIFDTGLNYWSSPITTGHQPSARDSHSAALVGHRLFVFGGCGRINRQRSRETSFNDLYVLDTITLKWRKAPFRGTVPAPRDDFTCSSYRNKLIVVGGEDLSDSLFSDVFILDADTLVWNELATFGQKLPPRCGHTTVALGENLFVFGGYGHGDPRTMLDDLHVLNVESGIWTKVSMIGAPSPRFGCAGDRIDLERRILFFGGCDMNMEAVDDLFLLDTESDPVMN